MFLERFASKNRLIRAGTAEAIGAALQLSTIAASRKAAFTCRASSPEKKKVSAADDRRNRRSCSALSLRQQGFVEPLRIRLLGTGRSLGF